MSEKHRKPSLITSFMPVIFIISALIFTVIIFGNDSTGGPAQVVLILSGTFASLFALTHGRTWHELEQKIVETMTEIIQPVLILLLIGALIGVWIISGIVPAIIVYGLKLMNPSIFLFAACVICAVVSIATGSSWSTAGTIGVALIGIAQAMGINTAIAAGAVISGAYFGDKMSPFSETTNLASSMAGTPLLVHIRHMLYTTIPAMGISLLLYLIIGFAMTPENAGSGRIDQISAALESRFNISFIMLIPPLFTFFIIMKRVPAIPSILIGTILGALFAVIFQPEAVRAAAGDPSLMYPAAAVKACLKTAAGGYSGESGDAGIDKLLNKGGMSSMLNTIWLIMSAMFFAGVMEASGMIARIAEAIMSRVNTPARLISATLGTAALTNAMASDQYLSIVISGRMYRDVYKKMGLDSRNLSRALEDSGTLTSALIPWNTCGSFMATTLGVATFAYLPFAFLNLITPVISLIYGITGYSIVKSGD
jgi:NhaC family Na+:H+ antiporter